MTTLDKLIFCKNHGISISYIASRANVVPATLTRWLRGEKGMSRKNEEIIAITLQNFAKEIWDNVGESNDRNL